MREFINLVVCLIILAVGGYAWYLSESFTTALIAAGVLFGLCVATRRIR